MLSKSSSDRVSHRGQMLRVTCALRVNDQHKAGMGATRSFPLSSFISLHLRTGLRLPIFRERAAAAASASSTRRHVLPPRFRIRDSAARIRPPTRERCNRARLVAPVLPRARVLHNIIYFNSCIRRSTRLLVDGRRWARGRLKKSVIRNSARTRRARGGSFLFPLSRSPDPG